MMLTDEQIIQRVIDRYEYEIDEFIAAMQWDMNDIVDLDTEVFVTAVRERWEDLDL